MMRDTNKLDNPFFCLSRVTLLLIVLAIVGIVGYLCKEEPYKGIVLLPFGYMCADIIFNPIKVAYQKDKEGILYKVIWVVLFIRYVLTPLSIALTGDFYTSYGNYQIHTSQRSINQAIFLMLYELVFIVITVWVSKWYYNRKTNADKEIQMKPISYTFVLVAFCIGVGGILWVVNPRLIIPSDFFVLSEGFEKTQLDVSRTGVFFILSRMFRPTLFLLLFSSLKERYDKTKQQKIRYGAFFLIMLFIGMYTGTTRWEIVFAGIIGLYLFKKSFGKIPKFLMGLLIVIVGVSFISASLYKFSWAVQTSSTPVKDISTQMFGMFQGYFGGPRVVANSLEMQEVYQNEIGPSTFINDFLGSVPGIAGSIDQSNRMNAYFNRYHYRPEGHNTQIIPMIGIGYIYFPFFPPIFTIICYWFVMKLNDKVKRSESIEFVYVYLYPGLYLAMAVGFNTQIVFTTFLQRLLPLYLLFKINQRMCWIRKPILKSGFKRINEV